VLSLGTPAAQAGLAIGQPAPLFELPSEQPTSLVLQQLRGQVVYLDFWASWCGPCRQSFPWMAEMHRRHAAQGLAVVAVNLDTRMADAQAFLKSVPAPFRIAYDPKGQTPREYAIKAMPTSLLIGRDGRVRLIHAGFRPSDTAALEAAILEALKESAK
jgi:thiol-disulfide isomerase/thioredoxin